MATLKMKERNWNRKKNSNARSAMIIISITIITTTTRTTNNFPLETGVHIFKEASVASNTVKPHT
jgi:hypothetical protein